MKDLDNFQFNHDQIYNRDKKKLCSQFYNPVIIRIRLLQNKLKIVSNNQDIWL